MTKDDSARKELIAHVARVEGQLAAVRASLAADDCGKAARTLQAASRSLSSLRAACVNEFMTKKVFANPKVRDNDLLEDVRLLMKT